MLVLKHKILLRVKIQNSSHVVFGDTDLFSLYVEGCAATTDGYM